MLLIETFKKELLQIILYEKKTGCHWTSNYYRFSRNENMNKEERQIVVPGEVIISGNEYLPGEGAYRDGAEVIAGKYGISNIFEKHVKVFLYQELITQEEETQSLEQ